MVLHSFFTIPSYHEGSEGRGGTMGCCKGYGRNGRRDGPHQSIDSSIRALAILFFLALAAVGLYQILYG